MNVRIVQWNICNRSNSTRIAAFLDSIKTSGVTIFCLQEVLENSFKTLAELLRPSWCAYSLQLREPGYNEGRNRHLGVAVFAFGVNSGGARLIERTVFPERSLDCQVDCDGRSIRIGTFHSLTGVDYKKAKSSNFASIADYLMGDGADLDFLCFDANEPKVDSIDTGKMEFFDNGDKGRNAARILGENKVHGLEDALIVHLRNIDQIVDSNPVAVSHLTRGIKRRYDFIMCSKHWSVLNVEYQFEAAIDATSDHAAIIGDFALLRA